MVGLKVSNDCKKTEPSKTNNLDDNLENDDKNEEPKPLETSLSEFICFWSKIFRQTTHNMMF